MKSFYAPVPSEVEPAPAAARPLVAEARLDERTRARIAIYDASAAAPRVEQIPPAEPSEYIEALSTRVYELAKAQGGPIPYTVIREVAENLIHAAFTEPVISVLDDGATIRFADQGPGIADKERAACPGFSTASSEMKRCIRGVGSGLPIVRDFLEVTGGSLDIEDNLGTGSVVTISVASKTGALRSVAAHETSLSSRSTSPVQLAPEPAMGAEAEIGGLFPRPRLTTRQKHVLAIVMESSGAGPSLVAKELGVGVSTAYRDLASLEELGLIISESGKRTLTDEGLSYLDDFLVR